MVVRAGIVRVESNRGLEFSDAARQVAVIAEQGAQAIMRLLRITLEVWSKAERGAILGDRAIHIRMWIEQRIEGERKIVMRFRKIRLHADGRPVFDDGLLQVQSVLVGLAQIIAHFDKVGLETKRSLEFGNGLFYVASHAEHIAEVPVCHGIVRFQPERRPILGDSAWQVAFFLQHDSEIGVGSEVIGIGLERRPEFQDGPVQIAFTCEVEAEVVMLRRSLLRVAV